MNLARNRTGIGNTAKNKERAMSDNAERALHDVIQEWPLSIVSSQVAIQQMLNQLRALPLSAMQRFALLEHIHQRFGRLFYPFRVGVQERQIPPFLQQKRSHSIDQLQQAIAVYYLNLLSELKSEWEKNQDGQLLRCIYIAMYRAMSYLREIQLWYYELYYALPPRLWYQMHYLYRFARQNHWHDEPLSLQSSDLPPETIEHLYQAALMLAACNPSRLTADELALLPSLFEALAPKLTLHEIPNPADLFMVLPASDQGPLYQSIWEGENAQENHWTLDTTDLMLYLKPWVQELATKPAVMFNNVVIQRPLMEGIVRSLGSKPMRRYPRDTCRGCVALRFLRDTAGLPSLLTVEKRNRSEDGYCLEQQSVLLPIHVGEAVEIRDPDRQTDWRMAVVRWLKYQQDTTLQMGVQLV
jgi:hypothetical protein